MVAKTLNQQLQQVEWVGLLSIKEEIMLLMELLEL
jgi:hypothetical protein